MTKEVGLRVQTGVLRNESGWWVCQDVTRHVEGRMPETTRYLYGAVGKDDEPVPFATEEAAEVFARSAAMATRSSVKDAGADLVPAPNRAQRRAAGR